MTNLAKRLRSSRPDMNAISEHLDGLDPARRLVEVRSLGRSAQRRLFDAAGGHLSIGLEDVVPAALGPMREVVHQGKNTLPAFSTFAKVFVRPDGAESGADELWGYNRNTQLLETTVGPGYFVAYPHSVKGEVLVDYLRTPPRKPAGWPPIIPNSHRLSFFVYNGTQDILRGVSKHVSIGRATKGGKNLPAWFILCRED